MKVKRKIIQIDETKCDGCGVCVPSCAEGALQIVDGKARLTAEVYCDGLGACLGECPQDALKVIEREAEDFDEKAVEKHLEQIKTEHAPKIHEQPAMACGCPSTHIQTFTPAESPPGSQTACPCTERPIRPDPLAGAGPAGAPDRALFERGGLAGGGRLHAHRLPQFSSGLPGWEGRHGGMPEIRRCSDLHSEVFGHL